MKPTLDRTGGRGPYPGDEEMREQQQTRMNARWVRDREINSQEFSIILTRGEILRVLAALDSFIVSDRVMDSFNNQDAKAIIQGVSVESRAIYKKIDRQFT